MAKQPEQAFSTPGQRVGLGFQIAQEGHATPASEGTPITEDTPTLSTNPSIEGEQNPPKIIIAVDKNFETRLAGSELIGARAFQIETHTLADTHAVINFAEKRINATQFTHPQQREYYFNMLRELTDVIIPRLDELPQAVQATLLKDVEIEHLVYADAGQRELARKLCQTFEDATRSLMSSDMVPSELKQRIEAIIVTNDGQRRNWRFVLGNKQERGETFRPENEALVDENSYVGQVVSVQHRELFLLDQAPRMQPVLRFDGRQDYTLPQDEEAIRQDLTIAPITLDILAASLSQELQLGQISLTDLHAELYKQAWQIAHTVPNTAELPPMIRDAVARLESPDVQGDRLAAYYRDFISTLGPDSGRHNITHESVLLAALQDLGIEANTAAFLSHIQPFEAELVKAHKNPEALTTKLFYALLGKGLFFQEQGYNQLRQIFLTHFTMTELNELMTTKAQLITSDTDLQRFANARTPGNVRVDPAYALSLLPRATEQARIITTAIRNPNLPRAELIADAHIELEHILFAHSILTYLQEHPDFLDDSHQIDWDRTASYILYPHSAAAEYRMATDATVSMLQVFRTALYSKLQRLLKNNPRELEEMAETICADMPLQPGDMNTYVSPNGTIPEGNWAAVLVRALDRAIDDISITTEEGVFDSRKPYTGLLQVLADYQASPVPSSHTTHEISESTQDRGQRRIIQPPQITTPQKVSYGTRFQPGNGGITWADGYTG